MIFVGIDWSEDHHDACIIDADGRVLTKGRVPEGVDGVAKLHEMVAAHAGDPSEVAVGIELDRGLLVGALVEVGYAVYAVLTGAGLQPVWHLGAAGHVHRIDLLWATAAGVAGAAVSAMFTYATAGL